ncbi:hypothetical protein ACW5UC_24920 [Priestia aryabhattai]|uniref:hypothetical protein n=1 Tax=Priestia megaterium TaxID=1404 RepID=UPI003F9B5B11
MARKLTLKQNVESILDKYEATRSDDKLLQLVYWKDVDGIDFSKFGSEYLAKATSSESITRARRAIQEEGRYLPTEEVAEMRKNREASMRKAIVTNREII